MKKLIFTLLAAGWAAAAFAQEETPTATGGQVQTSGSFEGGFWQVLKNPGSAKFQEYRQVKEDLILNRLSFDLAKGKYYFSTRIGEAGKADQVGKLWFGVARKFKNEVYWSQTPHLLSTSTRAFLVRNGPGVYTLPDSIQRRLQQAGGNIENFLQGAHPFNLSSQRNTARAASEAHPVPDVTVKAGYTNERKRGTRAHGVTIGSPGSFRLVELAEDLDHETHNFFANAEWAKKDYSAVVEYKGQVFNNKVPALVWDNPFQLTDAVGAPGRGRMSLYSDHASHNFSATGAWNLPYQTRSVATASYGIAVQNEKFLPHTINSAILDTNNVLALPAASLDGKFKTLLFNYQISSRPARRLSLKGKFRFYQFDNQTPELFFNNYVANGDLSLATQGRINLPYEYIKRNLGVDAGWHLARRADFSFGYGRENVSRNHREVLASKEDIFFGALDVRPSPWVTLRSSYTRSQRKAKKEEPDFFEESFPEGQSVANGEMTLDSLRRFDIFDRDRDKIELSSQLSPMDQVDMGVSFSFAQDDYAHSAYGLQDNLIRGWNMDVSYTPVSRLTLFGSYGREDSRAELKSRFRPVYANIAYDSLNNDWAGHLRDRFESYGFGFSADVWPRRVTWGADYGFTYSRNALTADFAPAGNPTGNAVSYPNIYFKLHNLGSNLSCKLTDKTALKFVYRYEKYMEKDWSLDIMQPYMGNVAANANRSVFLGATIPPYEVHVLALQLSYAF